MSKEKTPLEKLQEDIDTCNDHQGCDSKCCQRYQKTCYKLIAHKERANWCAKHSMPIEQW